MSFTNEIIKDTQKTPHHQEKEIQLNQLPKQAFDSEQVSQIFDQVNKLNIDGQSHSYRPQIDGLRTIAIMTVVIYHAFPDIMPGGFIGVDVFFVISGYLISRIIIKETSQNRFSYVNFYIRRIKRIYPALLLILIFVLYMVTKYYRYDQLGFTLKTLTASTVFGANFQVLAHQKTYFDPEIHVNPLLHLWSLGVEEQFYIFWPFLISIGLNVFKKHTFKVLALYTVLSFIFGIVSVFNNAKFAFYFPFCRFWQMSVGGIIAYLSLKIQNTKISNALSIVGTLLILIGVWAIDDESLFPGFWTLLPTLGAACIIQADSQPFINKNILSSKVFVFVGKISYPLYLWHWPLIILSRYFYPQGSQSIFSNLYFIILVSILLSIITYYFVQKPIRRVKTKKIAIFLLIVIMIIGCLSYWSLIKAREIHQLQMLHSDINYIIAQAQIQMKPRPEDYIEKNGKMIPNLSKSRNRKKPTVESTKMAQKVFINDLENLGILYLEKNVNVESKYYIKDGKDCVNQSQVLNQGKQNQLFFIGDSHAVRVGYRFQQLYRDSVAKNKTDSFPTVLGLSKLGIPLIGPGSYLFNCTMQLMRQHRPKRLLIAYHWLIGYCRNIYSNEMNCRDEQFDTAMKILEQYIREAQSLGVQVSSTTIALDHPHFDPQSMSDANGIIEENIKPVNLTWYKNKYKKMGDKLQAALRNAGAEIIDLTDNLCYEDVCQVTTPSGHSIYQDTHHQGKLYARHWLSVLDHLVEF